MNGLLEDVRYALRQVRKSPRLLIVFILGIGIDATATIFSIIEAAGICRFVIKKPSYSCFQ